MVPNGGSEYDGSPWPLLSKAERRLRRPQVHGKFLYVGDEKFWVRGVTYGTFRPDTVGDPYGRREDVERDFARIAASGLNAVRTYTAPPGWLLDAAARHRLRVMIDLTWEHHVTFLDDAARARSIENRIRSGVAACAGHPAVLWYAVGNEIPGPIVRWHGRRRVERYLERLHRIVKVEDPGAVVTYVNYPTTEYLDLPFLDVVAFNVYLEARERLDAYLARLQNLAGDRPLVLAEVGLDSRRHGETVQAQVLDWQIQTAFAAGCAGVVVFAWTDEWHRGGHDVEDWDFGLTCRDRRPKPALAAVRRRFAELPIPKDRRWPRISVVVCSYNGARTIRDCLDGLLRVEYPNFEVIVVDDGSTDATPAIAHEYGFRVISTPNRGLSSARNTGLRMASGEIVAYIDDDAYPDPHWLTYLAYTFQRSRHDGVGGPNIPPPGDGPIAECVANAPGGPIHVLLSDREAEHLPGCNMAFRKSALVAIGGFDPRFRVAGDDVDVCWRLRAHGSTLGFHPGAVVWHHRRNSVRAYWRQQRGYGKAEALLEQKWPDKYNAAGHVGWAGRLYGAGLARALGWRAGRVYHGVWGSAPFQSLYRPAADKLSSVVAMPEWYLVILALLLLAVGGLVWRPLLVSAPGLALAVGFTVYQAARGALGPRFTDECRAAMPAWRLRALTGFLHLAQPLARLVGRFQHGLTPWRQRGPWDLAAPWPWRAAIWRERPESGSATLATLTRQLEAEGTLARAGGEYDHWDLEVRVGALGVARLLLAIEEHGTGRQFVRLRAWPHGSLGWLTAAAGLAVLAGLAGLDHAWAFAVTLGTAALLPVVGTVVHAAAALGAIRRVVESAEFSSAVATCRSAGDASIEPAA
jgi:glycosyltransferase involved in cell wall biosynthesis